MGNRKIDRLALWMAAAERLLASSASMLAALEECRGEVASGGVDDIGRLLAVAPAFGDALDGLRGLREQHGRMPMPVCPDAIVLSALSVGLAVEDRLAECLMPKGGGA